MAGFVRLFDLQSLIKFWSSLIVKRSEIRHMLIAQPLCTILITTKMNLFLAEYVGAFMKWMRNGFKTKYYDEYNQTDKSKRVFSSISIENENMIIGLTTLLMILAIIFIGFVLTR